MNTDVASRISAASGDPGALLALAIELAQEVAGLRALADSLKGMEQDRKAKQAARTRKSRNGMSRDVTLQSVTERAVTSVSPSPLPSSSFPTPHITTSFPPSPSHCLPAARTIRVMPSVAPEVAEVVAHYCGLHPKRRPGPKDAKVIGAALALGYSVSELCEALTGNATEEWHRKKRKHDIPYVLRDSGQIDNFRAQAEPAAPTFRVENGWFVDMPA